MVDESDRDGYLLEWLKWDDVKVHGIKVGDGGAVALGL